MHTPFSIRDNMQGVSAAVVGQACSERCSKFRVYEERGCLYASQRAWALMSPLAGVLSVTTQICLLLWQSLPAAVAPVAETTQG